MNPKPPDLADVASEWTDRELFWITKHGIKLAGMPGFGITHSDEELWGIVAFLRRLQNLPPEEYARLAQAAGASGDGHDMEHGQAAGFDSPDGAAVPSDGGLHGMDHARTADASQARGVGAAAHSGMDHAVERRTPSERAAHAGVDGMNHNAAPRRGGGVDERAAQPAHADAAHGQEAQPAHADTEATEKLKALVAELLRDEFVRDRISADSSLRRRWDNAEMRKQLTAPPQSSPAH